MTQKLVWFNGKIVAEGDAKVNALSGTAQFGLNVFEGIRGYKSAKDDNVFFFRLQDHLERLSQSCKLIGIELPTSTAELEHNLKTTVRTNGFTEDLAVRITVMVAGISTWHSIDPVEYIIAPTRKQRTVIKCLQGQSACISSWERISDNSLPPRAKVGANYINSRIALLQARHDGYNLPIFLDRNGFVSESSGSCIFIYKDNKLITPTVTSSILDSITRDTLLILAKDLGVNVEERIVDRTELYLADEVFVCGTAAEITPITKIDRYKIGNGCPGSTTIKLLKEYHRLVSGQMNKFNSWLTELYTNEVI